MKYMLQYGLQITMIAIMLVLPIGTTGQQIVDLPFNAQENPEYNGPEKEFYSDEWDTQILANVSVPRMEVFLPENSSDNKTAVVIAPGGGYYALSIEKEGRQVAKWLNERGIAAFVLHYRLVPTEDAIKDIARDWQVIESRVADVQPLAQQDGLNAIKHVRANASDWGIDPDKIGFLGFSAGGDVTVNVGIGYDEESKPNFIVPVYAWLPNKEQITPPDNAPILLAICSTDDPLQLAPASVGLYSSWLTTGHSASLVMYAKGGHGFGMKPQGLASDNWIERFYEWAKDQGLAQAEKLEE